MRLRISPIAFPLLIAVAALLLATAESGQPPHSCDASNGATKSLPFCRTSLPIRTRVKDLVSRLTLDEKISQLVNTAPAIPRLGIPAYEWWSEALHGVADVGKGIALNGTIHLTTSFPQVILTAATFDANLWYRIGQVVGTEARAVYNQGQAIGMTFWAPNINIFRDPRWGRGQETPGEDPLVTGKYAVSYVRGVQGDTFAGGKLHGGRLQASACCKHFTAYDLDNWKGVDRFDFDAKVNAQDMADTFQPPFQKCIQEGKASGIMCSYNRVNGVPSCADFNLLSNTARRKWTFNGYITSDCDAVSVMHDNLGYAPEKAVADALNAGMDVNCGTYLKEHTKSAVEQRKVAISQLDRALHNLFAIRMRLGLFNGDPKKQPYGAIGPDQACSRPHQDLALEAARNGIVLLKNTPKLLPLQKQKISSLAVIGPNANAAKTLLGNYAGPGCKSVTPLSAIQYHVRNTRFEQGCSNVACSSASVDRAVGIARGADHVVLIMGLDQSQEREDFDRVDLVLPGKQRELITSVARVSKRPVVLVLLCGGPVDISFAKNDPKIGSILWAGYPGEAGGIALAEVIFGEHNPGGRLPMTWYPQEFTKVPMTDMRMRPQPSTGYPGRTYRFYKGNPVYKFGDGLSYSNYAYKFVSVSQQAISLAPSEKSEETVVIGSDTARTVLVSELGEGFCQKSETRVTVGIKNQGSMFGKHPVLLFVRKGKQSNNSPVRQLVGFQTVELEAGEGAEVEFPMNTCEHLSSANEAGEMVVEEGPHFLVVGEEEYPISVIA